MCASAMSPPVEDRDSLPPPQPVAPPELNEVALCVVKSRVDRPADELEELRVMWKEVVETTDMGDLDAGARRKVLQDVGVLLSMTTPMAQEFLLAVQEARGQVELSMKVPAARMDFINRIFKRMKAQPKKNIAKAEEVWRDGLKWKRDEAKKAYVVDMIRLLQLPEAMAEAVFMRVGTALEHKRLAEEEKISVASDMAPAAENDKDIHPRQAHPAGLGSLSINDDAREKEEKVAVSYDKPEQKRKLAREKDESESTQQQAPAKKRTRTEYVPRVGEWKCGRCNFWNKPWATKCRLKARTCSGTREHDAKVVQEDDGAHEKSREYKTFVPMVSDWKCGVCGYYNLPFDNMCLGEDKANEDPIAREICTGYRRGAVFIQDDDGKHEKHFEPEWIGDWWCAYCRKFKPGYVTDCNGCGNSKNTCCEYTVKKGPGKKERQPDKYRRGYYRNPGMC
ncbi:hypothetical protein BDU57DRAFT_561239 [Ampelomyces quisqualis]|uniref:RanBP2-type domain-containing protein n=1 Tax=Ampelomyces quisqualis TaxID=50730 RepID=A0A6A5QWW6_AMPQU|nr:hypothetical protein BDU57DRAFT_561239 [Ampelomyces quisqualis]